MNVGPKDIGLAIFLIVVLFLFFPSLSWFSQRRREKRLMAARGRQTADDFALLFKNGTERQVARRIYPRLQHLTLSGQFPIYREDLILGSPLNFDVGDLMDESDGIRTDLDISEEALESALRKAKTAAELVEALARAVDQKGGEYPSRG
jgi:hypothetical protein